MNLAALFVRRPVFATMLVALLLVLGLFSYQKLGVDLFPNVDLPVVSITTTLRGASPEEMEAQITKPIEEAVNTASGIDELRSVTYEGISTVVVTFVLERPTAEAVQDVRDKVAAILKKLPDGTDPPVITRFDTSAIPVATVVVSGTRSLKEITEYADKKIKEDLAAVSGVGQSLLIGGQKRAVNVWLDAQKLAAYHLSVQRVRAALVAQNVEIPTGRVDRGSSEQMLRTMARAEKVSDFARMVVATVSGAPVTIGDVGRVEDGVEDPRSLSRYDGRNAIAVIVQKQSGTNSVEVVRRVKEKVAELSKNLPPGVRVEVVRDISVFIEKSIHEVKLHLVLGGVLASIVVLLFMGSLRSTLIAAIAIPTSLIATFTAMRLLGFTLNNMTLLGLVLAVGIVIDDAIVVLENVYRHIDELGKSARQAAIDGTREIMLAVMATTLSLVVIFLPIAFMQGRVGRFFNSFGITTAVAILLSLVIAVVLTPMLCAVFLRGSRSSPTHGAPHASGTFIHRLMHRGYGWMVRFSMAHKWVILLVAVASVALIVPLFGRIGKDFLPLDDRGEFTIQVQTPPGSTLASSDALLRRLEDRARRLPHVQHLLTTIGDTGSGNEDVTAASLYVQLTSLEDRRKAGDRTTQLEVMKQARAMLAELPELRGAVQPINDLDQGRTGNYQLAFAIQGPDIDTLDELAGRLLQQMRTMHGLVDVDTATAQRTPEVRLTIDRRKAADLGVSAADIAGSLRTLVAGEQVSKFREAAEQYDVWLRLRPEDRRNEETLLALEVPSARGALVRLSNLVSLRTDTGPAQIDRLDRQRQVTLVANLDGVPLGEALDKVTAAMKALDPPPGYAGGPLGRSKIFAETAVNFGIAFLLSLLFMYMILAAQFESFLHPVTIMLSLPLSIPFALVSLLGLGETLNLYSIIGLFMLFGIVKKNGILQVDYTNTLRAGGMARDQAIYEANLVRLRPILMTTVTLIAGMIPIALGKGPGAAARASMAKVIIGGQALSLIISLLIVPVAYALFDDATGFLRAALPAGLRERRVWAYATLAGAGALGAGLVIALAGTLGELPPLALQMRGALARGGLVGFFLGIGLYRVTRWHRRRAGRASASAQEGVAPGEVAVRD